MSSQEYEQKKRERWEEYVNLLNHNSAARYVFDKIFDRAYALGKQTETITQEQIEKAAEKFADEIRVPSTVGVMVPLLHDIAKSSYLQGAQDFIGKKEKDTEEAVISGWVARERSNDNILIYHSKPQRYDPIGVWLGDLANFLITFFSISHGIQTPKK